MNRLLHDARFALRHYARHPGVTATMLLVLVIGMTIATSLFSFTRAYMTEPAPGVERAEDLVRIRAKWSSPWGMSKREFGREELDSQLASTTSFREVTAWTKAIVALDRAGADDPDWATAQFVTGPYFEVLGVRLAAGRGLPAERADGEALVAVVSRPLRERHFASDADALGRTLLVAGRPVTIVGVAPARFRGVDSNDDDVQTLWLPEAARAQVAPSAKPPRYVAAARLAPGGDLATASAAAAALASHVPRDPEVDVRTTRSADVVRMVAMNGDPLFEREMTGMLTGLSTLALLVLLVTGMNASALQTGLAMTRGREIAMRLSLGASRGRVLRQLLTESGLLGLVAGSLALALLAAIHQLGAAILANFPFPLTI
ncbi:MAG TPA: ABC transporter permease, partial [Candidatus Saccharimonadia bacterium]|nr:ABC transporter permease [Candidatus Saccharimonadia bacterium]